MKLLSDDSLMVLSGIKQQHLVMINCGCANYYTIHTSQKSQWILGCISLWLLGCMSLWLLGCMSLWLLGCMSVVTRLYVIVVTRLYVIVVTRLYVSGY